MGGAAYVSPHEYITLLIFAVTELFWWSQEKEALDLTLHFFY